MAGAIWKYPLHEIDENVIEMPCGSLILTLQMQNGVPCIWALCNHPEARLTELRRFVTYGTGHSMPEKPGHYVGTYQLIGGAIVFHVFEKVE